MSVVATGLLQLLKLVTKYYFENSQGYTIFDERFFEKTYFNIFCHNLVFEFHIFFHLFGSIQFMDTIFGFSTIEQQMNNLNMA